MRRLPAHRIAAPAAILFVLLGSGGGGAQETPEAPPPPAAAEPPPESQSAESDQSQAQEPESSSPDSSEPESRRPPRPPYSKPSALDLSPGEIALWSILSFLMFGLFSVVLLGVVAFVFAPVVASKESRLRNPTAQALRWALIGTLAPTIGFVVYEADYMARFSNYMQRYGLSVIPRPEQTLSDAFWENFAVGLLGPSTMVAWGFVFALCGVWFIRRRRAKSLQSADQLDAPKESDDA